MKAWYHGTQHTTFTSLVAVISNCHSNLAFLYGERKQHVVPEWNAMILQLFHTEWLHIHNCHIPLDICPN